jgi:hypothetical protein
MRRILTFITVALATVSVALGAWIASLGYYGRAEHWIADAYELKREAAERAGGNRILILTGSNGLFGFSSPYLSELLSRPVVNLSSHAGLPLQYHAEMAVELAKPGDTVLLPLEFTILERGPALTEFEIANLETWGYFYILASPARVWDFFRHSSMAEAANRLWQRQPLPRTALEHTAPYVEENSRRGMAEWMGYSLRSMNDFGDIIVNGDSYFSGDVAYSSGTVSDHAITTLSRLKNQLRSMGVQLVITWPTTMRNSLFDLSNADDAALVRKVESELEAAQLPIACDPRDVHFDRELFFDTHYHLNARGVFYRTAAVARCLDSSSEPSPEEAYLKTQSRGIEIDRTRKAVTRYVSKVLADLTLIGDALERYRADNGEYPKMERWAGVRSAWGDNREDWIPALSPEYLDMLPQDPRRSENPRKHYIYRSNGMDYKLLASQPDNCDEFRRVALYRIDPNRECDAVGIWTARAWWW